MDWGFLSGSCFHAMFVVVQQREIVELVSRRSAEILENVGWRLTGSRDQMLMRQAAFLRSGDAEVVGNLQKHGRLGDPSLFVEI